MPFTVTGDGNVGSNSSMYVTRMVTGEPGRTVPADSLTLRPDGAETVNAIGPLAALRVNEPLQPALPGTIDTVPGDSLRTGGGGGGFGLGFGGTLGGADDTTGDGVGGLDDGPAGADEPGDGDPLPAGAELGRAGSGPGRPG
jgi:hypothetical protein